MVWVGVGLEFREVADYGLPMEWDGDAWRVLDVIADVGVCR